MLLRHILFEEEKQADQKASKYNEMLEDMLDFFYEINEKWKWVAPKSKNELRNIDTQSYADFLAYESFLYKPNETLFHSHITGKKIDSYVTLKQEEFDSYKEILVQDLKRDYFFPYFSLQIQNQEGEFSLLCKTYKVVMFNNFFKFKLIDRNYQVFNSMTDNIKVILNNMFRHSMTAGLSD